jgi:hypothetical protein
MFHKRFLKSGLLTDLPLGFDFKTLKYNMLAFEAKFPAFCSSAIQSGFVLSGTGLGIHPTLVHSRSLSFSIKAMD